MIHVATFFALFLPWYAAKVVAAPSLHIIYRIQFTSENTLRLLGLVTTGGKKSDVTRIHLLSSLSPDACAIRTEMPLFRAQVNAMANTKKNLLRQLVFIGVVDSFRR